MTELDNPLLADIGLLDEPEFFDFVDCLHQQLIEDEKRWGDTWKYRPIEGQEMRIFGEYDDYYDQYAYGDSPIPWLKIVGLAYIAWVREKYAKIRLQEKSE